jgi:hypothetical protein
METLQSCTREVLGSNLDRETNYPDSVLPTKRRDHFPGSFFSHPFQIIIHHSFYIPTELLNNPNVFFLLLSRYLSLRFSIALISPVSSFVRGSPSSGYFASSTSFQSSLKPKFRHFSCLVYSPTMKMEATCSSETSVNFQTDYTVLYS